MKFVHIADMHFDTSFAQINNSNLGNSRRLEQRKALKKVIEYIKENNVDYLFIAGDFYEHKFIRESTIEYINKLFKEIESTKIFITPGNHDPYIKNSFYNKYNWNNNVHIFNSQISCVTDGDVNIYGYVQEPHSQIPIVLFCYLTLDYRLFHHHIHHLSFHVL